jgi:hypothetical protein
VLQVIYDLVEPAVQLHLERALLESAQLAAATVVSDGKEGGREEGQEGRVCGARARQALGAGTPPAYLSRCCKHNSTVFCARPGGGGSRNSASRQSCDPSHLAKRSHTDFEAARCTLRAVPACERALWTTYWSLQAIEAQQWTEEPTVLPDAYTWPTWGALRERVLQACKTIRCEDTPTVRDAFAAEIVQLSPPELTTWSVRCS